MLQVNIVVTYFLNLASCSEHFISIKHRILATFNINKKNQSERLYAFKCFQNIISEKNLNVGEIAINTPNYKSAVFSKVYRTLITAINNQKACCR
jgi:hypothetical protein